MDADNIREVAHGVRQGRAFYGYGNRLFIFADGHGGQRVVDYHSVPRTPTHRQ